MDALRACAVLLVLVHHTVTVIPAFSQGAFGDFGRFCAHGVDLFFVISGFLFGSMLLGELKGSNTIDMKRFYKHRFLRIVPLYWFATFVSIPLCFLTGWCGGMCLPWVPKQLLLDLTFLHTLKGAEIIMQAWASWSLAIEIWFYLLIPPALIWLHRLSKNKDRNLVILLGLLVLAGFLVRAGLVAACPAITDRLVWLATSRPYARFDELLIGVLAYVLGRKIPLSASKPLLWIGGVVLIAAYLIVTKAPWSEQCSLVVDWVFIPTLLSVGFACILIGTLASKFQNPFVTFTANLSYSLYLMHAMFLLVVSRQTHAPLFAVTFVVGSMIMAYLASALVEYPFLKLYKKPAPVKEPAAPRAFNSIEFASNLSVAGSGGKP